MAFLRAATPHSPTSLTHPWRTSPGRWWILIALPSVPLDPKFASDFGPSMRSKLLVAHVPSLEATFQAYATPVQGTPLAMSDLLCPLDFLHQAACSTAAPALNNVLLVLGRLC